MSAAENGTPLASRAARGYQPVEQDDNQDEHDDVEDTPVYDPPPPRPDHRYRTTALVMAVGVVILLAANIYLSLHYAFSKRGSCPCLPSDVPQYFQTSPELWPGPTATGQAAFMAQTRVFEPTQTYVPNEPLQTGVPIEGMQDMDRSIFKMMGYLSPYSPSPGFGVDEYPIPAGAEIVQVQMLSRHGSRYPTGSGAGRDLASKIANSSGGLQFMGNLRFLETWEYHLGSEILVPKGREELYESGALSSFPSAASYFD